MFGSECIYHEENCIIDHVTKRATDVNRIEKKVSFEAYFKFY